MVVLLSAAQSASYFSSVIVIEERVVTNAMLVHATVSSWFDSMCTMHVSDMRLLVSAHEWTHTPSRSSSSVRVPPSRRDITRHWLHHLPLWANGHNTFG
jgi:hypothetical protein